MKATSRKPVFFMTDEIKTPPMSVSARREAGFLVGRSQETARPLRRHEMKGTEAMDKNRIKRLEKAGWKMGDFGDAFALSAEDRAFVEMRLAAAREVDRLREEQGVSQRELARRMGTKQPTVSRMLSEPSSTTFDSLFRALLALGSTPRKIAAALAL